MFDPEGVPVGVTAQVSVGLAKVLGSEDTFVNDQVHDYMGRINGYSPCLTDCLRVSEFSRWVPFRLAIFEPISWATSSNEQMNDFNVLVW